MLPLTLIKQRRGTLAMMIARKKGGGITNYGNFQACNQDGKLKSEGLIRKNIHNISRYITYQILAIL